MKIPYRSQQPINRVQRHPHQLKDEDSLSTQNYMQKQAAAVKASNLTKSMAALTRPDNLASIYNERTELDAMEKKRRKNTFLNNHSLIAVDSSKAIRIGANVSLGLRSDSKPKRTIDCAELKEMTLKPYQGSDKAAENADLEDLSKDIEPSFVDESGMKSLANTQELSREPFTIAQSRQA
jgi:hypothetical protein